MKRFFKRLLETGAICWFGMAALLAFGSFMAWPLRGVLTTGGHMSPHDTYGSISIHDAAILWLIAAGIMTGIGIALTRLPSPDDPVDLRKLRRSKRWNRRE